MAGRVEERGRADSVAEAIEQTFIKLEAGNAAEQKRDSREADKVPARTAPRERRRGGTTRLDLADVLGSTEAAARMRSRLSGVEPDQPPPLPSSETLARETPVRRAPRERRKGGTTRLDLADVLGSSEAAARMRNRLPPPLPDKERKEPAAERRQRLPATPPGLPVRANPGRRLKGSEAEPIPEFEAVGAPAADTNRTQLAAILSETESGPGAALMGGPVTLTRVDVHDKAKLASVAARYPEVNIFDNGAAIIILADLPGLDLKMLAVTSDGRVLTIAGNRRLQPRMEGALCRWRERSSAPFMRTLQLPETVEFTRATATYRNGILEIRAPKGEPVFKITVQ
jgi:HSP20 family protein